MRALPARQPVELVRSGRSNRRTIVLGWRRETGRYRVPADCFNGRRAGTLREGTLREGTLKLDRRRSLEAGGIGRASKQLLLILAHLACNRLAECFAHAID
jgi:hypothetical protein